MLASTPERGRRTAAQPRALCKYYRPHPNLVEKCVRSLPALARSRLVLIHRCVACIATSLSAVSSIAGLSCALLGWAVMVISSRVERERQERHTERFGEHELAARQLPAWIRFVRSWLMP